MKIKNCDNGKNDESMKMKNEHEENENMKMNSVQNIV